MTSTAENNKRIAKNTLMLYFRMFIIMGVTLYTSRIVLEQLGVEDYGVYNLVAGIIVLFSFITNSLQLASQRFFSYELENSETKDITSIFKSSVKLYFIFSIIFVIACQTVGYWLLITKLNIPIERKSVAIWVYEISILTGVISIFRVPYNALIIAYEEIAIYAKYSIYEVILKVGSIVLLILIDLDKLILYTILVAVSTVLTNLIYIYYCHRKLLTNYFSVQPHREVMRKMLSFSGWMLMLGVANVSATQGVNFILNIAYGVVVNAAIGVANQVNSAVNQFVSNFQTSLTPQLIKSYAANNFQQLYYLLFTGSRLSFYLLLILCWPIILNIDIILSLWLKIVPPYTSSIVIWVLVYALVDTFVNPIAIVVHATGNIKKYQFIATIFIISIIPICYGCINLDMAPWIVFMMRAAINVFSLIWRIYYMHNTIQMSIRDYCKSVMLPCVKILLLSGLLFLIIYNGCDEITRLIISICCLIVVLMPMVYFVGLNRSEQMFIKKTVLKILHKNG